MEDGREIVGNHEEIPESVENSLDRVEERVDYVMIPRVYSEQITITPRGPLEKINVLSTCTYSSSRSYKNSVLYTPRIVPIHYYNSVYVNDTDVIYTDCVYFKTLMKPKNYAETVYNHSKCRTSRYCTTLTRWNDYKSKWYVQGLEIVPGTRLIPRKSTVQHMYNGKLDDEIPNGVLSSTEQEITVM
ncbi:uncharacterized protein LOC111640017 [Centruroides sculpturatus]|uniref:uncharacterized protein LOC111640017 n=1 Tax=Centruroides sculpturatus TaxID=218467 RepID=UPI000C6C893B|nr:uncharacterized protein LOC111640017 [Centruroides sculpturatus]XP_023241880.1 uncharacterized protein LOC111640017 [Centruroides sculpturatus]